MPLLSIAQRLLSATDVVVRLDSIHFERIEHISHIISHHSISYHIIYDIISQCQSRSSRKGHLQILWPVHAVTAVVVHARRCLRRRGSQGATMRMGVVEVSKNAGTNVYNIDLSLSLYLSIS